MRHDTKIAIVVREDLATWQKLNVTACLAAALAAGHEGLVGQPYEDACGGRYLALLRMPALVFGATGEQLAAVRRRCAEGGLVPAIFTDELFSIHNEVDGRAAVRAVPPDKLSLAGLALHDRRTTVDRLIKGLRLHP